MEFRTHVQGGQVLLFWLFPCPPFVLVTVSFFGLASYLLLIGIYSSAVSVAEDSNLRRSIEVLP